MPYVPPPVREPSPGPASPSKAGKKADKGREKPATTTPEPDKQVRKNSLDVQLPLAHFDVQKCPGMLRPAIQP